MLIVGYGGIGSEVERLLRGFDVEVVRVARTAKPGVLAFGDLAGLLPEADVVVLLVPLTDATRGMMNADMLARMKPGALLINAARGPVVDTDALVRHASQAHPRRAGCDGSGAAAEGACSLECAELFHHAAHCRIGAGFSSRGYKFAGEQVRRYMAGEPMLNQVTRLDISRFGEDLGEMDGAAIG